MTGSDEHRSPICCPTARIPRLPFSDYLTEKSPPAPGAATLGWKIELVSQGLGSIFPHMEAPTGLADDPVGASC